MLIAKRPLSPKGGNVGGAKYMTGLSYSPRNDDSTVAAGQFNETSFQLGR